jgi:hypothetical protein
VPVTVPAEAEIAPAEVVIAPLTTNEVPVAAPSTGVVSVGVLLKTTFPVPVLVVVPVPPLRTGNAVPESVTARVPVVVIGLPAILRNAGTLIATEVTVPVTGVVHVISALVPALVSTWPLVPVAAGKTKFQFPVVAGIIVT